MAGTAFVKTFFFILVTTFFCSGCMTITDRFVILSSAKPTLSNQLDQTKISELLALSDQLAATNQLSSEYIPQGSSLQNSGVLRRYSRKYSIPNGNIVVHISISKTGEAIVQVNDEPPQSNGGGAKKFQKLYYQMLVEHFGSDRVIMKKESVSDPGWLD